MHTGVVPILLILSGAKANVSHVHAAGKVAGENSHEFVDQVLVKQQRHATELASRRSRAAANARAARMSSRVRSGKSLRISSSVIPPARYSSRSYTVMRVPLMHGLPLRTVGFTETRSCHVT